MAGAIRVGIVGAGWPGEAHAKGYEAAGGFKLMAVADLIPERRKKLMNDFGITKEYCDASELIADKEIDAVSICLPNYLHARMAVAALKAGKHVICEKPPAITVKEAKQIESAAKKEGKVILYSMQRRFGPFEQAAKQAIAKGYAGEVYHVRATWLRSRGVPIGTGWFTNKAQSGGGALVDIGVHMLDLGWYLLGQPKPSSAYGLTYQRFAKEMPPGIPFDVEDEAFAMIRFEGGKSLELAASWAINQAPQQNGAVCRVYGDAGALEVYTPEGAVLYRQLRPNEELKASALKPPKTIHHAALMRHFKECISGKATPIIGGNEGVELMRMIEAIYHSNESGKSVGMG